MAAARTRDTTKPTIAPCLTFSSRIGVTSFYVLCADRPRARLSMWPEVWTVKGRLGSSQIGQTLTLGGAECPGSRVPARNHVPTSEQIGRSRRLEDRHAKGAVTSSKERNTCAFRGRWSHLPSWHSRSP